MFTLFLTLAKSGALFLILGSLLGSLLESLPSIRFIGSTKATSSTSKRFSNTGTPQPAWFQALSIIGKPEPRFSPYPIHSVKAGIILIVDGCDMTKGRARIPLEIPSKPTEGDIHKYSANSIEKVKIGRGNECPLKIEIHMRAEVGFFQVEEVLIPKIQSSPAKSMLELYPGVEGEEMKRYM